MKKLVYMLFVVVSFFFFVACDSDYDSEMFTIEKKDNTPQPTKKDSTVQKTEEPQKTGLWGTVIEKKLAPVTEKSVAGKAIWRSTITLQKGDSSIVELSIEFPVCYSLSGPAKVTTTDETATAFTAMPSAQPVYGGWHGDGRDTIRTVTTTREVRFSHFTHTLVTSHVEAYTIINGKRESFKTSVETSYYKSLDRSEKEVERNDSIFLQETCTDNIEVSYNGQVYKTSHSTIVERFVKIKKTETPTEDNTMPSADITVDKLVNATALVASPRFNSQGSAITKWHKTSLVETENSYFIWVDGQFIREVAKSTLKGTKYNAAMLDGTTWVPCLCSTDGKGGWNYAVVFADGSYKTQTVDQRLAVNSGLKSFTENNTASQTPFIKTVFEKKSYSGKQWWKITGYNVDGKTTISYTVAEK